MTPDMFGFDAADPQHFEPTPAAAQARLHAVRPADYARTRNHLDGAVTRLSPYLTHGLLSLPQVLRAVRQRHPGLPMQHKLVQELGWRAYFHHVWAHDGDGILSSRHEGPLPDAAYAQALPADLREARTGVPVHRFDSLMGLAACDRFTHTLSHLQADIVNENALLMLLVLAGVAVRNPATPLVLFLRTLNKNHSRVLDAAVSDRDSTKRTDVLDQTGHLGRSLHPNHVTFATHLLEQVSLLGL